MQLKMYYAQLDSCLIHFRNDNLAFCSVAKCLYDIGENWSWFLIMVLKNFHWMNLFLNEQHDIIIYWCVQKMKYNTTRSQDRATAQYSVNSRVFQYQFMICYSHVKTIAAFQSCHKHHICILPHLEWVWIQALRSVLLSVEVDKSYSTVLCACLYEEIVCAHNSSNVGNPCAKPTLRETNLPSMASLIIL